MRALGIDFYPMALVIVHVEDLVDRLNRADRNAGAAIDANVRVDVGPLGVSMKHSTGQCATQSVKRQRWQLSVTTCAMDSPLLFVAANFRVRAFDKVLFVNHFPTLNSRASSQAGVASIDA